MEHDPNEIWSTQVETAVKALSNANNDPKNVAAIGITNQRETTVVWDKISSEPICNAIVWQDRRTADIIGRLKEDGLEEVFRKNWACT